MMLLGGIVIWPAATAVAVVGLFTLLLWRRHMSPLSDIPGPFLASFTRLWQIYHIIKGDQNLDLMRRHEKHGYFVRISHDEVSVSHPDGIKKILRAPLEKAPWYNVMALPDSRFQSAMSTTDPKKKIERSNYLAPAYKLSSLIQQEDAISQSFEALLAWLDQHAEDKTPFDLDKFLSYATFDVVGEVIFSKRFGFLEQGVDIGDAIGTTAALSAYLAVAGYFRTLHTLFLANPVMTWLAVLPMGHLFNTSKKAVNERMDNEQDARFDVLAYWLKQHRANPEGLTLRDIHAQAIGAIGAGSDTVSCAIQSFVYHMIQHPNAWQRARDEIDAAIREKGICQDRVVSFQNAQQLRYLQACIKEALRIFSPVPMGLPRLAPEGGLTIGDQMLPAGTILSISPWVYHHSKEFFGEDADDFNPDRWLEGDIAAKEKYLIPFGMGYASCPGQNVAKIELSKITATLVRDYNVRLVNRGQQWTWKAYFTVMPHNWPVFIEKRQVEA